MVEKIQKKQRGKSHRFRTMVLFLCFSLASVQSVNRSNNENQMPWCSGMSVEFEGRRDDHFQHLMSWARDHGASCEGFAVTNFGAEGYGLRATRDIKVSSVL